MGRVLRCLGVSAPRPISGEEYTAILCVRVRARCLWKYSCSCVGVGIGRAWASVGQAWAKRLGG